MRRGGRGRASSLGTVTVLLAWHCRELLFLCLDEMEDQGRGGWRERTWRGAKIVVEVLRPDPTFSEENYKSSIRTYHLASKATPETTRRATTHGPFLLGQSTSR